MKDKQKNTVDDRMTLGDIRVEWVVIAIIVAVVIFAFVRGSHSDSSAVDTRGSMCTSTDGTGC